MPPDPDHPITRRRSIAAQVATIADFLDERLAPVFVACQDPALDIPIPPPVVEMPAHLRRWATAIQRGARP